MTDDKKAQALIRSLRAVDVLLGEFETAVDAVALALARLAHGVKLSEIEISDQRQRCRATLTSIHQIRADVRAQLEGIE